MALSWINPLYLAGLLLLALPVLIHLVQRRHSSGFKFPSLMFLRQIAGAGLCAAVLRQHGRGGAE